MDEQVKKTWPGPKIVREPQRLSPEQQQAAARHLMQAHVASMFSCAAIDEAQAEARLRQAYRVAGLEPPQIRWFDSPLSFLGHFAQEIVRGRRWDDVKGRIFYCIRDSMWHRNSMMQRVWHSAWEGLVGCRPWDKSESVWHDMLEIVWQTLYASVWDIVWDGVVRDFPKVDIAWLPVSESIAAYYDFEGLLFYQFFHETYEENDLIHFVLFNEMVSGYQLGEQEARLVRMPTRVERDEQGRLHCASGRCMQYRDGWGFYAWHGVKVPEKLILHPEQLTKEEWLTEENLEVRRAMQERLGPDRFIELVGARCIDQGRRGTLMEVDLGNDPERVAHYVQVRDASTERLYFLRVPPSIQRADEAVAWTFALQEQDYNPVQET